VLTTTPGLLLVATEHELVWFDWATGVTTPWLELEPGGTGNRMNDGRCDPAGRFVVGSMSEDTAAGRTTGILHRIDAAGAATTMRTGVGVSNGIAFDPARRRMYFADSPTETVWVYDYDAGTGEYRDERVFLDYGDLDGKPDGACTDADGCYWSASVYGWAVIRVTPDGAVDRRIPVPVEKPSMPAFGGADLTTLFVTSIGDGGSKPSAPGRNGVAAGALLAIDAGVQGVPEPAFAGSPSS
jgi:sugar lactone lactonase YvrE